MCTTRISNKIENKLRHIVDFVRMPHMCNNLSSEVTLALCYIAEGVGIRITR